MTKLFLTIAITLGSFNAMAREAFVECSGYHHGTYVDFQVSQQGVLKMALYGDGEEPAKMVHVSNVQKSFTENIAEENYESTILEAVKASSAPDNEGFGMNIVLVKGSNDTTDVTVNLNGRNGDNFLVVNGYVEPLTCSVTK